MRLLKIMSPNWVRKTNQSNKDINYLMYNKDFIGTMSTEKDYNKINKHEQITRKDSSESEESNETILFSSLTPVDEERYVPKDLIPVDRRLMDDEWAKQTFRYAHLFDINKFKSKSWESEEQLVEWIESNTTTKNEKSESK